MSAETKERERGRKREEKRQKKKNNTKQTKRLFTFRKTQVNRDLQPDAFASTANP